MNLAFWCRVGLTIALATACGDDGGGSSAPKKCRALLKAFCEKAADCDLIESSDVDDCVDDADAEVECDEVKEVPDNYEDCLEDVEEAECSEDIESLLDDCE